MEVVARARRVRLRRLSVLGVVVLVSLLSGLAGALIVATGAWGATLQRLGIAMPLYFKSSGDLTLRGSHVRIIGDDGNFELEHAANVRFVRLKSFVLGTAKQTPVAIGSAAGQDVVELIVRGTPAPTRKSDLQEWTEGRNRVVAAIDAQGHLRLGHVTLSAVIRKGHVVLVGTLPSGKREIIGR